MSDIEFTILMPCLNEENTIGDCIKEAKAYIKKHNINAEILVADNESTDNSVAIANYLCARVISGKEKGYGAALIAGINEARGTYIIMADCDMSYDFYHINGFVKYLRQGYSFVIGNRFTKYMEKGAMIIFHKYLGVPLLSLMGRIIYKTDIKDFHCGMRGFKTKDARQLELKCPGMEFATEMIAGFVKGGYSIKQVPIIFRKDKRNRPPHLQTIPDGIRHVKYMLRSIR